VIVDSSALVAVMLGEPDAERLLELMDEPGPVGVGAPTLVETGIVLAARLGPQARTLLGRLSEEIGMVAVPFGDDHVRVAGDAWARFGRGRHPAGLNFGDCMSYATARIAARPLLCVGDDFRQTDLPLVGLT